MGEGIIFLTSYAKERRSNSKRRGGDHRTTMLQVSVRSKQLLFVKRGLPLARLESGIPAYYTGIPPVGPAYYAGGEVGH